MNILVDFNHPVDVNFFKNAINILSSEHNIVLTFRDRGKLKTILEYELDKFKPVCIGKHQKGFFRKVIGQLLRDVEFLHFQKANKIDLCVCFGATNAIAAAVNRIPFLAFDDDAEYKIPFYLANIFSSRHIMPNFIKINKKNIYKYRGFKELAYLHPTYFKPDNAELWKYNLAADEYIFIREIDNVSLNYKSGNTLLQGIINHIKEKGLKIILSLENNFGSDNYKNDCIILEEPVNDIYSLMKFALFTISSGDTVARESCLLGTPAIYRGGREMAVNNELIRVGIMSKLENYSDIIAQIDVLAKKDWIRSKEIEHKINTEWDDVSSVIINHIKDFDK